MTKQHILAEIRRTAKANGGKPLGKSRFFRETGIKESDWEGKYWVRWGDAVREAGFEPNAMQPAYDKNLLIEKFIATMRELGHFPTEAELRFKSYAEPSFPSSNTFDTRLGPKRQAYWHKRFEAKHKNGEWFDLSQAEVQVFKRRKFM